MLNRSSRLPTLAGLLASRVCRISVGELVRTFIRYTCFNLYIRTIYFHKRLSYMTFDDIRPYRDDEIKAKLTELLSDQRFSKGLYTLLKKEELVQWMRNTLAEVTTVKEIQMQIMRPLLRMLIQRNTNGITVDGINRLDPEEAYIFISNHRDIVTDAAFLNILMTENNLNTTEIAIGSNLLIYPWIENVVRSNRAFVVKRNVPLKEMLLASRQLSNYIRHAVTELKTSIWIAQREGRTKDGDDKTQATLLKMLNMSNPTQQLLEGFKSLKIIPLSISYEIEPCGASKVKELMLKNEDGNYKKTLEDDLFAMNSSLEDSVGGLHFHFGEVLDFDTFGAQYQKLKTNKLIRQLATHIDQKIYKNYRLWKNNYIAYDSLYKTNTYQQYYNTVDKKSFGDLTKKRLSKLGIYNELAIQYWLRMYANPVKNCVPVQSVYRRSVKPINL